MNEGKDGDGMTEQWAQFTKFWTDVTSSMTAAAFKDSGAPPPEVAARIRESFFQVMSDYMDAYLRSPEFLEYNKQSMDAALAWRRQMNDMMTKVRHENQGTAKEDVDTLLRSVKHLETRLLDRLEELEIRLDELNRELRSLKKRGDRTTAPTKSASEE